MQKNGLIAAILASCAMLGAGCSNAPATIPSSPTTNTSTTTGSTAAVIGELPTSKPNLVTVFDNIGMVPAQLNAYPLIEVTQKEVYLPDHTDELHGQAVRYYHSGDDMYFALTQHGGSMSLLPASGDYPIATGIWYATPQTEGHWKQYLEIKKDDSQEIQNGPFHFWTDGKTVNVLAIDYNGAGSGEGVAKVLTSEDYGRSWYTSHCFYYTSETFPEINAADPKQRLNFGAYLAKKFRDPQVIKFTYNGKTNAFERAQRDKTTGQLEQIAEPSCQNLIVKTNGLTADTFSSSMIADGATAIDLPIVINQTEPVYHVSVEAASTTSAARIIVTRGENKTIQYITIPSSAWSEAWRAKEAPSFLTFRDVNFDGYTDIGLTINGGAKWGAEQYWIFDVKTKKFVTNQLTNDLRKVTHNEIRFDTSTERITTNNFIGPGIYKKTVYGIKNGRLATLEDYEQEPVYENDAPTGQCKLVTKKDVNGRMTEKTETLNRDCDGYMQL